MDYSSMFQNFPGLLGRLYSQEADFGQPERGAFPPLNIGENHEAIYIRALIPGVDLSCVSLTLRGNRLVMEGEIPLVEGRYGRQERYSGPFRRVVSLGVPVAISKVRATMSHGVLEIVLPKATPMN